MSINECRRTHVLMVEQCAIPRARRWGSSEEQGEKKVLGLGFLVVACPCDLARNIDVHSPSVVREARHHSAPSVIVVMELSLVLGLFFAPVLPRRCRCARAACLLRSFSLTRNLTNSRCLARSISRSSASLT